MKQQTEGLLSIKIALKGRNILAQGKKNEVYEFLSPWVYIKRSLASQVDRLVNGLIDTCDATVSINFNKQ